MLSPALSLSVSLESYFHSLVVLWVLFFLFLSPITMTINFPFQVEKMHGGFPEGKGEK